MNIWDSSQDLDTPDKLIEFGREALKQSRINNIVPPMPTPLAMMPGMMPIPGAQQHYPDQRLTSIAFAVQGLLALGLADAITHLIPEEP